MTKSIEPWDHGIGNKWPAARAVGPNVTADQALEYVFRTDPVLIDPEYACNDRRFCDRLAEMIGLGKPEEGKWAAHWELRDAYSKALGHIPLEHLGSRWIATSYIDGPHGLVSPTGAVSLAQNFGKWPSVEGIERDLAAVAEAFPWLKFGLWLWDSSEESEAVKWGSDPTHAWAVGDGSWKRTPTENACANQIVPSPPSIEASVLSIAFGTRRETTWTIERIDQLFGEKIRSAMEQAKRVHADAA